MAPLHRVYFLGNLTRDPEVWYAPNGTAVARCGVAVPTRLRQGDTWHDDVCCIDVVAFGRQAEMVGASLCKGRGVLIEGRLQWRRWEQEGQSRRTREVIAERIQCLFYPREAPRAAAGVGRAPSGARLVGVPSAADPLPVSGRGECWDACGVLQQGGCARWRFTAQDAHEVRRSGGQTRGAAPSAPWSAHAAIGGIVTPLVP